MRYAVLTLVLAFACAGGRAAQARDDDLERIERAMAPEPFTPGTPGADGIALVGAPPMAPPFPPDPEPELHGIPVWGWGGGWPVHGASQHPRWSTHGRSFARGSHHHR